MKIDRSDARLVVGFLVATFVALWCAAVLGAAIYLVRLIGGI